MTAVPAMPPAADVPADAAAALPALLKRYFGYDAFRPLQREIMEQALAGRDTLAILPTGAGKSLCYQLPALAREGLTVVVSPLIALMKDQVDQLQAAGVAATALNSSLDASEARGRHAELWSGRTKILFVAPERLVAPEFLAKLAQWKVAALAVDEAHCISEWGHDFRPEYRQLRAVREALAAGGRAVPTIALTATATPRVREDIVAQLGLAAPEVFVASFNRPNLTYRVVAKDGAARQVVEFVRARPDDAGIVYCQSRRTAEAMAAALVKAGVEAAPYHAGLEAAVRARNQDKFLRDDVRVVCATVAFGMGINKPNVRFVVHADLPKNVEGYYQETGRAGRDGLPSECVLLYSRGDVAKYIGFLDEIEDEAARRTARAQLDRMAQFADSARCRRVELLAYFGEAWRDEAGEEACGACDNCLEPRQAYDATVDSQKFLSCVLRIRQKSGFGVGLQHVADVLVGADNEKVRKWWHNELSTYGIGKDKPKAEWLSLGRQLVQAGLLALGEGQFPTVELTAEGVEALRSRAPVLLVRPVSKPPAPKKVAAARGAVECDEELFTRLKAVRREIASERGVPPYIVFNDATLRQMAALRPANDAELLLVPGVGEKKRADFGGRFLEAIRTWSAASSGGG
ncbi:MAG: DNA helicase RecQ [Phycisphaerales bacterium]